MAGLKVLISSAVFLARSLGDSWFNILADDVLFLRAGQHIGYAGNRVNMAKFERNVGRTFLHDNTMACRTFDLNLIHVTFSRMTRKFSEKGRNSMGGQSVTKRDLEG